MDTKIYLQQLLSKKTKALVGLALTIILIALDCIFSVIIIKQILELVIIGGYEDTLPIRIILLLVSMTTALLLFLWKRKQVTALTTYVVSNLSLKAYSSILEAEIQEIKREEIADVSSRIVSNSNIIGKIYFANNFLAFFEKLIYLSAIFITLMIITPLFGLILYGSLPIFYLVYKGFEKYTYKYRSVKKVSYDKIEEKIADSYGKIKDIKLLNGINIEKEVFTNLVNEYSKDRIKYDLTITINQKGILYFSICVVLSLILGLGSWLSWDASYGITTGTIVVFVIFVPTVFFIFKGIMQNTLSFSIVEAEKDELDLLFSLKNESKTEPINSLDEVHNFKFVDVSYSLSKKEQILTNISFELKRGEKLGILSVDKESKQLIYDMTTKLIKPTKGVISINNCDINKINTVYLRDLITSISDSSNIFDASIVKNIIYPNRFDDYKYNDALNRSGLKELLAELPKKENTIIGPKSRQQVDKDILGRVLFANAFYKDSKVYILQDATSGYDPSIEAELLKEVFKLKNKIVIMLTDKVYNLSLCDKILILEEGQVLEYGRYEELLQDKNSEFYRLIKKVSLKKEKIS